MGLYDQAFFLWLALLNFEPSPRVGRLQARAFRRAMRRLDRLAMRG